jgi:hypothetical protein
VEVDKIARNIDRKLKEAAGEGVIKDLTEKISKMQCESCGGSFSIQGFIKKEGEIIVHYTCNKCKFEGDFAESFSINKDEAPKNEENGFAIFQEELNDINHRLKI